MVCTVKQVVSDLTASYVIEGENAQYGTAKFAQNFIIGSPCEVQYKGNTYRIKYLPPLTQERKARKKGKWHLPFLIQKGDTNYGTIYNKDSEGFFLTRYGYQCLELDSGPTYEMYEVGLGKNGMAYSIYREGTIVAEIDKGCTVYNNMDIYTIYAVDEEAQLNAILICLLLDGVSFANRGEITKSYVSKQYVITTNKKLRAKYDPDFKKRASVNNDEKDNS